MTETEATPPREEAQTAQDKREALLERIREMQKLRPPFVYAVIEDARMFCDHRSEKSNFDTFWGRWTTVLRLMWAADDFLGVVLYRARASLRAAGVPILPRLLEFANGILFSIRIGDEVVIREGVYIPHGNIDIGGITLIGRRCYVAPWVGIGLVQGEVRGPTLEDNVFVGVGALVLGNLRVGTKAIIGASAVVMNDVPPHATMVGIPAAPVSKGG